MQKSVTLQRLNDRIKLAEMYALQKRRLITDPYPEEFNDAASDDENPPVVKKVIRHTQLKLLFRRIWPESSVFQCREVHMGFKIGGIGNRRILYTVHNYYKVVILHHFDKQYNGDIKWEDIEPAEDAYFSFWKGNNLFIRYGKGE